MQATKCGIKLEMKNKLNFHVQLYLRKTQFDVILKCDSVSNLLYHKHSQDISSSEEDSKKKKKSLLTRGSGPAPFWMDQCSLQLVYD